MVGAVRGSGSGNNLGTRVYNDIAERQSNSNARCVYNANKRENEIKRQKRFKGYGAEVDNSGTDQPM
jgi:hypothetical protein